MTQIVPKHPVSCHCGGDTAYVIDQSGLEVMLGCACHTTLDSVVGLINERMTGSPELIANVRAALRLLYPEEMTPHAKRLLEQILERHS